MARVRERVRARGPRGERARPDRPLTRLRQAARAARAPRRRRLARDRAARRGVARRGRGRGRGRRARARAAAARGARAAAVDDDGAADTAATAAAASPRLDALLKNPACGDAVHAALATDPDAVLGAGAARRRLRALLDGDRAATRSTAPASSRRSPRSPTTSACSPLPLHAPHAAAELPRAGRARRGRVAP